LVAGSGLALLTTLAPSRQALASFPEIMGCETACPVAAAGWPLVFLRDYPGMSVVNRVDLVEVLLAADRFDWAPFLLNVLFWSALTWLGLRLAARSRRR
jgi:hypothetical protein